MYEYYNPPIINLEKNEYEFMLCHSFFHLHPLCRLNLLMFEVGIEVTGALSEFGDELYEITEDIATNMLNIERALCLWSDADILYWGIVYDADGLAHSRFRMPDFLSRFKDKANRLDEKIIKKLSRHFGTVFP